MTSRYICKGDGVCLTQTIDCNTYEKDQDVICEHNCKPQSCPNVEICGSWQPKWLVTLKRSGCCIDCDSKFKKTLNFVDETECPMCFETSRCVIQPNCTHPTCIKCFKRCNYGEPDYPPPVFPYPEIEEEYFELGNDEDNPKFNDPLIQKYNADYNLWEDLKDQKYYNEQNLRKCPICRQ